MTVGPCANCPRRREEPGPHLDDVRGKWCGSRGPANAPLAIVGIAPGKHELVDQRPFVGGSGRIIRAALASGGIDFDRCHAFNVIDCYPAGDGDVPTEDQIQACRGRFLSKLHACSPHTMLLLGNEPLQAVCQFTGARNRISHWDGYLIQREDLDDATYAMLPSSLQALIATYHPAFIMRTGNRKFPWFRRMVVRAARATRGELSIVRPPNGNSNPDSLPYSLSPSLDIETGYPVHDRITLIGLAWRDAQGRTHGLSTDADFRGLELAEQALSRPEIIVYNANFDLPRLIDAGVVDRDVLYRTRIFDPMWAAALLDPDAPGYSLNNVFAAWCDGYRWKHKGNPGGRPKRPKVTPRKTARECSYCAKPCRAWSNPEKGKRQCEPCAQAAWKQACEEHDKLERQYNLEDAFRLQELVTNQRLELVSTTQMQLFDHEMSVLPMLIEIHMNGLRVDPAVRDRMKQIYDKWATRAERIWDGVSGGVNPRSPLQLKRLLYEDWGMPVQYKEEKVGGKKVMKVTTEKIAIQQLASLATIPERRRALVALIHAKHRRKYYSTYLDVSDHVYPSYAPGSKDDAERGKSAFHVSAATGRIVAKSGSYRGAKTFPAQQMPKRMRMMVVPTDPDNVFVATDWSSQELRIIAGLSQDPVLLEQIALEDAHPGDKQYSIHSINERAMGIDRTRAKNAFYGYVFGGGWRALLDAFHAAGYTHVSAADTKRLMAMMRERYRGLAVWHRELVRKAELDGYLENGWGRRRYFADPRSNFNELVNFPVQSSGADMQWTVVPQIFRLCREYDGWYRIPMHDEAVCEIHPRHLDEFVPRKQAIMAQEFPQVAKGWSCPVETKVGKRWYMRKEPVWQPAHVEQRSA